jgi:hypothetical protein
MGASGELLGGQVMQRCQAIDRLRRGEGVSERSHDSHCGLLQLQVQPGGRAQPSPHLGHPDGPSRRPAPPLTLNADMPSVYFAASISGGREEASTYLELATWLSERAIVLTEHVADQALAAGGESALSDREIHDRDLAWLAQADAVVAEVTVPSLGVGYEVARALQHGIPVLCLYRPVPGRRLSAMIAGASGVEVVAYEHLSEAKLAISRFLS